VAARFTTEDPVRDGVNWFAYVNDDPVNWVDLWGLAPGDVFPNEIEAVKDFSMTYNDDSIRNDKEYASSIFTFQSQKTGDYLYSYTVPNKSTSNSASSASLPIGNNTDIASYIHTHGAYSNKATTFEQQYDYNIPSDIDQEFARDTGKPVYTVGPAGAVNKFDPAINSGGYNAGIFINSEWNNIPKDPRDVVNPLNNNVVDLKSKQKDDPYLTIGTRQNSLNRNDNYDNKNK
jgi:hypothetical protein